VLFRGDAIAHSAPSTLGAGMLTLGDLGDPMLFRGEAMLIIGESIALLAALTLGESTAHPAAASAASAASAAAAAAASAAAAAAASAAAASPYTSSPD
jgi:hypothetical protein